MNYGTFMIVDDVEKFEEHIYFPMLVFGNIEYLIAFMSKEVEIIENLQNNKGLLNEDLEWIIQTKRDFRFLQYQHTFKELEEMFKKEEDILGLKNKYNNYKFQTMKIISIFEFVLTILCKPSKSFLEFLKRDKMLKECISITKQYLPDLQISYVNCNHNNEKIEYQDFISSKYFYPNEYLGYYVDQEGIKTIQCRINYIINDIYHDDYLCLIKLAKKFEIFFNQLNDENIKKLEIKSSAIEEWKSTIKELQYGLQFFLDTPSLWRDKLSFIEYHDDF